jgi:Xaa-Pro aminopeptidase
MSESEISNKIAFKARELGSEGVPFHIICTSGTNTALPHLHPTNKKVKAGELVLMDFGCTVNGFAASLTRTVAVGKVSKEQQTVYSMLLEAQNATFENLRPGIQGPILEGYARKIINESGYGEYFKTNIAHGVGISYNESPVINSRDDDAIVPADCVMAVEPAIYIPDKFGIRITDSAVVTTGGVKQITFPPEEIEVI